MKTPEQKLAARKATARYRETHPSPRGGSTGRVIRSPEEVQRDRDRGMRACTKCGEVKVFSEFHKNQAFQDGVGSQCKPCVLTRVKAYQERMKGDPAWSAARRAVYLRHRFNLTAQQYDDLYDKQLGRCPGCQRTLAEVKICIDHDHACCLTARSCGSCVRGLLCDDCNQTLGRVRDDAATLRRLATYITGD